MIKKKVLLVDDEAAVLEGVKRALRPLNDEWSITSATSAKEALEALQSTRFDVVVTDIQMPEMSGAELLHRVKELYPSTIRVILSGDVGNSLEGKGLNMAHQVVMKPCNARSLIDAVQRAFSLRRAAEKNKRRGLIEQLGLSSDFSLIGDRVKERMGDPTLKGSVGASRLFTHDEELATRLAGAYEALSEGFQKPSPEHILDRLGKEAVAAVVAMSDLQVVWGPRVCPQYPLQSFWRSACSMARYAVALTRIGDEGPAGIEKALAAGLLHNVGSLILAAGLPERYQKVMAKAAGDDALLPHVEREILGVDSDAVGAWYVQQWGFSESIVEAVGFQRNPSAYAPIHRFPLAFLHVARQLIYGSSNTPRGLFDGDFLESVEISSKLCEWTRVIEKVQEGDERSREETPSGYDRLGGVS